ncbi:sugar ABC transporter ATP-binding protein [Candidatus Shapirobacteria bacterium CG06_land_8_20_14_3_00_40_12]|uniref:Sugar ABC transporter ATP-binding protein n=1 Tax=Candidatus Shapirobacteria bacterium CG06_land_8_20_14_3_00_40_12 TaxID=1974881 RepID=A0A2M7AS59_9BACT|nr:MAG: sugar ABC transporter ATP-binding protein [Candidatus Shapirobacteria bacterium CG06_land_8_20_14_3_00_40_12]
MKQNNLAVKLVNISKIYQLHHEKPTLVENIFRKNSREKFVAIDNINLEIEKGEKVGIIGPNGSGKTTLLKLISGIATPNQGKVQTWGKLVSLIDLSAGFHPELTGIENVYQNAMLLGMNRKETGNKLKEIADFADIGGFFDAPMYTYSDGMKLRLGFSVAIAAEPDVLILDEGVAVGDENFQKKSSDKIEEFFRQKKTIIVVSHWLEYIKRNCKRIIWMSEGKILEEGGLSLTKKYEDEFSK